MEQNYVHLEWDSDFFGFNIARINKIDIDDAGLTSILQELKTKNYRMVYWYIPVEQSETLRIAQAHGGFLADKKVTYIKELTNTVTAQGSSLYFTVPYLDAEPDAALISLTLQSGGYSRFRLDPLFSNALCDAPLNEKWKSAKGVSIDTIKREVSQASGVIQEILGIPCKGICAPKGYFNGLRGRSDILEVLQANSIRFVRSYARNKNDWMPVSLDVQPFWYGEDGFHEILEVPAQGWQDIIWRRTFGWNNKPDFLRYLKKSVDYIVENQLVWSCGFHDWSCIREDPELSVMKIFFEYAIKQGATFMSHFKFFEMMKKEKDEYGCSFC